MKTVTLAHCYGYQWQFMGGARAAKTVCTGQNRDRSRPPLFYIVASAYTYLYFNRIEKQCELGTCLFSHEHIPTNTFILFF